MEIDSKPVAKNPRKKTSQQVSKSAQISGDNPVENIQKGMKIILYHDPRRGERCLLHIRTRSGLCPTLTIQSPPADVSS
jgi:hypothetical protein